MNIRPEKITSPYGLLSVFLIAIETIMVIFRVNSVNLVEQYMLTGGILGISVVFFLTVYKIYKLERSTLMIDGKKIELEADGKDRDISQVIGSSKGDFSIIKPEGDWIFEKSNTLEIHRDFFNVDIPWFKDNIRLLCPLHEEILVFRSPSVKTIQSTENTHINGEKNTRKRDFQLSTSMFIIPLNRINPRFEREQTLAGNTMEIAHQIGRKGYQMLTKERGEIVKIGKHNATKFEFLQTWKNVLVNGKEKELLKINVALFVVKGSIKDYAFIIKFASGHSSPEQKKYIQNKNTQLCQSIHEFNPQTPTNFDDQIELEREKSGKYYKDFPKIHTNKRRFERVFEENMKIFVRANEKNKLDFETVTEVLCNLKTTSEGCSLYYEDIMDLFKILDEQNVDKRLIQNKFESLMEDFKEWNNSSDAYTPIDSTIDLIGTSKK